MYIDKIEVEVCSPSTEAEEDNSHCTVLVIKHSGEHMGVDMQEILKETLADFDIGADVLVAWTSN